MIVSIVFLICSLLGGAILKKKNNDNVLLAICILAISLLVAHIVIYILKVDQYAYSSPFDYQLSRLIGKINISFFSIKTSVCIIIAAFLSAMFYLCNGWCFSWTKKAYIGFYMVLTVYIIINSNWFAEYMHIWYYEHFLENQYIFDIIKAGIVCFSNAFVVSMCLLPFVRFFREYIATKLIFIRRGIVALGVTVFLIQTIFLFLIYSPPLIKILNSIDLYNIESGYHAHFNLTTYYLLILTVFATFVLATFVLRRNMSLNMIFGKQFSMLKKSNFVMNDIRHVFHTNKNAMMIMDALNTKAIEKFGTEESLDALLNMRIQIRDYTDKLCKFLDSYNTINVKFESIQLVDCVKNAVARLRTVSNVDIRLCVECADTMVYGDAEQFTEMFYNIISNADDALKNKTDGIITIKVWSEDCWVCVTIHDNGVGMSRRVMHNISKPLFSTKKTFTSMGIGFTYARKIAETHGGFINFRSKQGKFSEFQVIIPMDA